MSGSAKLDVRFKEVSERHGTVWRRVAVVECRHCGATESVSIKAAMALLPPVAIAKKFAQRGWSIGANETWHVCPKCVALKSKRPALTVVPTKQEVNEVKLESVVTAAPPRTMQRDDRRIVFDKLNGVYLDEKRGYETGWSDQKVANDLGVPRAWVEQVREEMFGPLNTNPEMEEFVRLTDEMKTLQAEVASLSALRGQMINIDTAFKKVDLGRLLDRINRLEKLATEVKKHISG